MAEPNAGRDDAVRAGSGSGNAAPERLGKIEKFILIWVLRKKRAAREFHSRRAALYAYYGQANGLAWDITEDVRGGIPLRQYRSLQVRFTNALGGLRRKGYVEIHRSRAGRQLELPDAIVIESTSAVKRRLRSNLVTWPGGFRRHSQPALASRRDWRFHGEPIEARKMENWRGYVVNFRLTPRGRARARALAGG